MKIILGLGNPGSRYEFTRHNVGWLALDKVAERTRAEFAPAKGDYYAAEFRWKGRKAVLIKPTTWMNNSGDAARQALRHYNSTPAEMLVVVDEFQFPVGKIKISPSGSAGGHNGLLSVCERLGTESWPRLRIGIGSDFDRGEMVDYVLSGFSNEERQELDDVLLAARDAILDWIALGTSKSMNVVNRRITGASDEESKNDR
jgi:PTH1 family peptidyl-tRNA hydrolase